MKVAIISHTEHYADSDGIILGWGPTIKEINQLSEHVESLIHIAPLHSGTAPQSSMRYSNTRIQFIPIKPSGGEGVKKFSILASAYSNIRIIKKALKEVDIVQFRAPTGIGVYILPYLKFFNNKKYWVKYAGNWKDENMPLGNKFQKWWLQNCTSNNTKITINGVNAISKNGAPTDSFLPNINSAIKGHIVPMKTTIVETTSSKLFKIRPLSRLMGLNTALERKLFALNAYKDNAPPIAIISISNIKTPRSGSFANA